MNSSRLKYQGSAEYDWMVILTVRTSNIVSSAATRNEHSSKLHEGVVVEAPSSHAEQQSKVLWPSSYISLPEMADGEILDGLK